MSAFVVAKWNPPTPRWWWVPPWNWWPALCPNKWRLKGQNWLFFSNAEVPLSVTGHTVLFQGEEITCKCSKVFNINVILKHLNHPKVQCAKFFTPLEMEMLEEEAKKRTDKEKKRRWRNSEKFKIKEMIDTINQNLDKFH